LTTADLVAAMLRLRHQLTRAALGSPPAWHDWIAALGTNGCRRLATTLTQSGSDGADGSAALPTSLTEAEARSVIARAHYISLAKSHFLSVLIVLVGIAGLGIAQDRGVLPVQTGAIPTVSAILIVIGLVLLATLGRIAIDVTAEPFLEAISQLSAESNEIGLLRRIVALLEPARDAAEADWTSELPPRFPAQLVSAFEEGHRPLLDAIHRLSENTQALEAALHSSAAVFETNIRAAGAQERPVDDAAISFAELQAAVEELTAVLRRLGAVPEETPQPVLAGRRTALSPGLARELRRLLSEIDAAR
jgi:methyl-accepting chemotaxis protein